MLRPPTQNDFSREPTERNEVEKALRQSEQVMRYIIKHDPNAIAVYDQHLNYIAVSDRYLQDYHVSEKDILGKHHYEVFPEMPQRWKDVHQRVLQGATERNDDDCFERPDGTTTYNRWECRPWYRADGAIGGMITYTEVTTERKMAEKALSQSEAHLRTLVDTIPDLIWLKDIDGVYISCNPMFERFFGAKESEIAGKTDYDFVDKELADFFRTHDRKAIQADQPSKNEEWLTFADNGYHGLFETIKTPMRNTEGNLTGVLGIARDITDLRNSEKEKIMLERQLKQSQKMESIGTLAGGIAHYFNNILSSVIGFTELALDEVEKDTTIADSLQEVYTAGNRARDIVRQILAFARQSDEELKLIRVDTIVIEFLKFIRSAIPTTITIEQSIDSDSSIMGNPDQMHQILMNLCTNAAHAMELGGTLKVGLQTVIIDKASPVTKKGGKAGAYIELTVSDTGAGISPDILEAIFDPYFTSKGPGEGSGMGLAVVHGIVESYGGNITVDSALGKGSTFTIYLPITEQAGNRQPDHSENIPHGSENILFVDDEAPIAKMGCKVLERLGYQVSIQTDGVEALKLFRSKPHAFDLVITDLTMPNMAGDKLAVELINIRHDIPVIICTGYGNRISNETAHQIGIKAVAHKPMATATLAKTVRKVLDDKQATEKMKKILVIDDEPQIRKMFRQILSEKGYTIIEACDGNEGIKQYRENQPDLVITDLVMPEKEGIETIIALRKEFPEAKIIAISGGGRNHPDAYLHFAKTLGAERTFSKPLDWPELTEAVRELLNY
jgi:PAS domain S-box-containing protein